MKVLDTRDDTRRGNVLGASADAVAEAHLGASAAADVFANHSRADQQSSCGSWTGFSDNLPKNH